MRKAIEDYYKRLREESHLKENITLYENISKEIELHYGSGYYPVERTDKTDLSLYEDEYGYELPAEIQDYINIFWHTHIHGYCYNKECIVLFPVLKMEGDNCNDILWYKHGIIHLAKEWEQVGDIKKYVPIGWLSYSGGFVLYDIGSGKIYLEDPDADIDGVVGEEAIANNLVELINSLNINGTVIPCE